jgi:histidyl-tRNA synthetase
VCALLQQGTLPVDPLRLVVIVALSDAPAVAALVQIVLAKLTNEAMLEGAGSVQLVLDPFVRKPHKALKASLSAGAHCVLMVGDDEAKASSVTVKHMHSHAQALLPVECVTLGALLQTRPQ